MKAAGYDVELAWHVGEVVIDHQRITLKPPVSGAVTLVTDWYNRQTQALG